MANGTGTLSLKKGCYPLIARYFLESQAPTKFTNMLLEDFEHVFESTYFQGRATDESKLLVILKNMDIASESVQTIGKFLARVNFSKLSDEFVMDSILSDPRIKGLKEIRYIFYYISNAKPYA